MNILPPLDKSNAILLFCIFPLMAKSTHCSALSKYYFTPPDLSIVRSCAAMRAAIDRALVIASESRLSTIPLKGFFSPTHSPCAIVAQMHNPSHLPISNNTYVDNFGFVCHHHIIVIFCVNQKLCPDLIFVIFSPKM